MGDGGVGVGAGGVGGVDVGDGGVGVGVGDGATIVSRREGSDALWRQIPCDPAAEPAERDPAAARWTDWIRENAG